MSVRSETAPGESDAELLHEYVRLRSEASFTALVGRHSGWVQAVVRRGMADQELAREAVQNVFICLARKAARVNPEALGPWLHRTAVLECRNLLRREQRGRRIQSVMAERVADTGSELPLPEPAWRSAEPLLDDALNRLPRRERTLLVMRYFQRQSWREIGSVLGRSEDAARMALRPALDRLALLLRQRGAAIPLTALAAVLTESSGAHAAAAVPELAGVALRSASGSGATTLTPPAGLWVGGAAFAVAGLCTGFWLLPIGAAPAEPSKRSIVPAIARPADATSATTDPAFDLTAMLQDLQSLEPSGNDPALVVRLRAACVRMPDDDIPAVLEVLRTRRWNSDSRLVAMAFFERWGQLHPEAAFAAARSAELAGTGPEATAAVFRGMGDDNLPLLVRLVNALPGSETFGGIAAGAARASLGKMKTAELMPWLRRLQSTYVRYSVIDRKLFGEQKSFIDNEPIFEPLEAEDCALLASASLTLQGRYATYCVQQIARLWSKLDEPAARAWLDDFPAGSPQQTAATAVVADRISRRDPAAAMTLIRSLVWNDDVADTIEGIVGRWIAADRAAAMEWLTTADIPEESKQKLSGKK